METIATNFFIWWHFTWQFLKTTEGLESLALLFAGLLLLRWWLKRQDAHISVETINDAFDKIPFVRDTRLPKTVARASIALLALFGYAMAVQLAIAVFSLTGALSKVSDPAFWDGRYGNTGDLLRGVAFTIGAVVGVPFLVWRSWVAQRQADISEQGLLTDRFTKAVEQLGADKVVKTGNNHEETEPNIEVRLGALYALERISQDSERDHIPIMETICAYVRENTEKPRFTEKTKNELAAYYRECGIEEDNDTPEKTGVSLSYLPPRVDIQAALTILGRRSAKRRAYERRKENGKKPYALDLRNSHMDRADLTDAEFDHVLLDRANLTEARLDDATLTGAWLNGANLTEARLSRANLTGAELYRANLTGAELVGANLTETDFAKTFLQVVFAKSVDFASGKNLTQDQIDRMFGDETATLPDGMTKPDHWPDGDVDLNELHKLWQAHIAKNTP